MVEPFLKMILCVPNGIQSQGKKNPPKKGGELCHPRQGGGPIRGERRWCYEWVKNLKLDHFETVQQN